MNSDFQKVIDIIASDPNWKQIALSVAKTNPLAFIVAHSAIAHAAFMPEMKRLLAAGALVEAIKYVRGQTGWGLKEAKDFVDQHRTDYPHFQQNFR